MKVAVSGLASWKSRRVVPNTVGTTKVARVSESLVQPQKRSRSKSVYHITIIKYTR